eukprot:GHVS01103197.1.p2 GENE.GHVS01103197.1~~GHVS01103197.1.p2  ORF type:complete len:119 (-),score=27.06 GHVS01103197.1:190-546(-)
MFVSAETFHNDVMVHETKAHVMAPQSSASSSNSDTDRDPSSIPEGDGGSSTAEVAVIEEGGTEGDGKCGGVAGVASLTDCIEKVYVEVNSFLTSVINKQRDSNDVDELELEEEETEEP